MTLKTFTKKVELGMKIDRLEVELKRKIEMFKRDCATKDEVLATKAELDLALAA